MKKKVLFICTHNSARSQMAEGLLRELYGDRYEAYSAGTEETTVNPYAIEVMRQAGIDISHHRSKTIESFRDTVFDLVVTVCDDARSRCPFFPGKKVIHVSFEDPSRGEGGGDEEVRAVFVRVRDEIRTWIRDTLGK